MIWLLQGLTASATRMPVENAVLRAFGAAMQHARAAQYIAQSAEAAERAIDRMTITEGAELRKGFGILATTGATCPWDEWAEERQSARPRWGQAWTPPQPQQLAPLVAPAAGSWPELHDGGARQRL